MAPSPFGEGGNSPHFYYPVLFSIATQDTADTQGAHPDSACPSRRMPIPEHNPNPMKPRNFPNLPASALPAHAQGTIPANGRTQRALRMTGFLALFLILGHTALQAQCELACRHYAPVFLDGSGQAVIQPQHVLNNFPDPDCPGNILITVSTMQGVLLGNDVNCSQVGDTLMITALHLDSGNACWGSVIIRDDIAPVLQCPTRMVFCVDSLKPATLGYPQITENCGPLNNQQFTYTDQYVNLPCSTQVILGLDTFRVTGRVTRNWSISDGNGNPGSCAQTIWLRTVGIEDITFPPNRDGLAAPALQCGDDVKNLNLTGRPMVGGLPLQTLTMCDMAVDTFDNVFSGCTGGAYRTMRTWRFVDYCRDTTFFYGQDIRQVDNQAPVITAPADITVGTSSKTCDAPVILPTSWTGSDNCSSFTVNASWAFGSGFGPYLKVPMGKYPVTYSATDACGNTGTATMFVTVADNVKPTAVCKKDVNIALPSSGIITVPASLFDDGSYDNCELDHLQVSRDNKPFNSMVTFNCNDIGGFIMVVLKAVDKVGLSNTCMMLVQIQDKLAPAIQCPNDVTLSCSADIKNFALTGMATGTDNCQMKSVTFTDTRFLNQCQVGFTNRLWTAEDVHGNKSGCLQVITQVDPTPISIVWPDNFSSFQCGQDTSANVTGRPVLSGVDCENVFVTYVDKVFQTAFPACYRIERCWEVREWCSFNQQQNPNPGFWQYVQYIDIYDNQAPALSVPADITIGTTDLECHGILNIPPATATDCNPNTFIINNSPFANSGGASINGTYPVGVHTIMFTAMDGCGNNSMATMRVTVVDNKPPLAICNNGVSIGLNMNGVAILPVSLIDNNSRDNCTPFQGLTFQLSPNEFSCDSLGPHEVTLTVTDAMGNSNLCKTIVVVQDNLGICPSGSKPEASGMVMSMTSLPVSGVEVWLNGQTMVKTNDLGFYQFKNLDQGQSYTIAPALDKQPANGVSVADLILIQSHIMGKKSMTDPYQLIAADVNNSGNISISDIVEIRRVLLGHQSGFSQVPSWQFVDADHTFKNPLKPTAEPYPNTITIPSIQGNMAGLEFVAIKTGDVNQSAKLNNFNDAEVRGASVARLVLEDRLLEPGLLYAIPVWVDSDQPLTGMQWQIDLMQGAARLESVETGGVRSLSEEMMRFDEDAIRLVWHQNLPDPQMRHETLLVLQVRPMQRTRLSEILAIGGDLRPEAITLDGQDGPLDLHFLPEQTHTLHLREAAWPNPFRSETNVSFTLDKASEVTLRVFDEQGRLVWVREDAYPAGRHQVVLSATELGRSGTYRFLIETPNTRPISQTLVLIDE